MRWGWLLVLSLLATSTAQAQREHTVRSGQSLARVAGRYDVSVTSLAAANQLTRGAQLRPGQVLRIPEPGTFYVGQGDALSTIARDHQTTVAELRRLNRLSEGASLRLGQRLVLPGYQATEAREQAANRWGRPRAPGVVTLYRHTIDTRLRVRLVDSRGRARRVAMRRIQEMMRPRAAGRNGRLGPAPPARLVEMLARISDHFGGREITITSGYRGAGGYTRETSRHTAGRALDIRVQGVPNPELRDFVRQSFSNVGVGFYPRSHFVHIDVRDRPAYWVDSSGPGQAPSYQRRGQPSPDDDDADSEEVAGTQFGGDTEEEAEEGEGEAQDPEAVEAPTDEEG